MAPIVLKFYAPRFRKKIAMFDYDGTLVRPKEGRRFPKDVADWEWTYADVPKILQETYGRGFMIIICTQQSKPWKVDQIRAVLEPLNIPMYVSIAMDKAEYKPNTAIFEAVVEKEWKRDVSFMVGDALGRYGDWSDCDRMFAEAINVQWKSPEAVFAKAT
jgi:bifunctional polynucleotide phosphatase/kinase